MSENDKDLNNDSHSIYKLPYQLTLIFVGLFLVVILLFYKGAQTGASDVINYVALTGLILLILFGYILYTMFRDLSFISERLKNIISGDLKTSIKLESTGTLASISQAINTILLQRIKYEETTNNETNELNNAVVNLLHGVNKLSQKDLTARVDITEDATAPIADSLNILADEISSVLSGVSTISNDISIFCNSVKEQSDIIINYANEEREQVDSANSELKNASNAMIVVAELANKSSDAADKATESTLKAKNTVINTVESINTIREIIRETEKRIKRLGDRSQEISSIVGLINTISERTHILAVNASIHAASTGEAGKGFVVIAEEVQRLAESAREATGEITSLVNNIQVETNDTVVIMNNVITEVVNGTKLAQEAETKMEETMTRTEQLVQLVEEIRNKSDEQNTLAKIITERANTIKESILRTNNELQMQSTYADKLVGFSKKLVDAVGVFKLPDTSNAREDKLN